jgi:hypothetical protein
LRISDLFAGDDAAFFELVKSLVSGRSMAPKLIGDFRRPQSCIPEEVDDVLCGVHLFILA